MPKTLSNLDLGPKVYSLSIVRADLWDGLVWAALPQAGFMCYLGEHPSGCQVRGRLPYVCLDDKSENQIGGQLWVHEESGSTGWEGNSTPLLIHL